jgi:type IV secretory pathway VirB10-like protein
LYRNECKIPAHLGWRVSYKNSEANTTHLQTKEHSDQGKAEQLPEPNDNLTLIYESSGKIINFLRMSDDYIMKCPLCKTETKYIVRHIGSNTYCKNQISLDEFKSQCQLYKKEKTLTDQVNQKKLNEQNEEKAKREDANHQRTRREKQKAQNEEKAKKDHANHQRTWREKGGHLKKTLFHFVISF